MYELQKGHESKEPQQESNEDNRLYKTKQIPKNDSLWKFEFEQDKVRLNLLNFYWYFMFTFPAVDFDH